MTARTRISVAEIAADSTITEQLRKELAATERQIAALRTRSAELVSHISYAERVSHVHAGVPLREHVEAETIEVWPVIDDGIRIWVKAWKDQRPMGNGGWRVQSMVARSEGGWDWRDLADVPTREAALGLARERVADSIVETDQSLPRRRPLIPETQTGPWLEAAQAAYAKAARAAGREPGRLELVQTGRRVFVLITLSDRRHREPVPYGIIDSRDGLVYRVGPDAQPTGDPVAYIGALPPDPTIFGVSGIVAPATSLAARPSERAKRPR